MNRKLKLKLIDYERFIIVLITLSCYLYMGAIITTYFQPSDQSTTLFYLTCALIIVTSIFLYRYKKIKDIVENEQQ